jgi:hypothetical protein
MINWIKKNKNSIIRVMFIIPIILVAAISISHVTSWYDLSNPIAWSIYLSVSVEIAAMTALSAASVRIKGFSVWMVFSIVTLIQFIGNIFFSYKEIDVNNPDFKSWVELVTPLFDMVGLESGDILTHKRWLSLLTGGLLPLISLTCLHFFIKYGGADDEVIETPNNIEKPTEEIKKEVINEDVKETPMEDEGKLFITDDNLSEKTNNNLDIQEVNDVEEEIVVEEDTDYSDEFEWENEKSDDWDDDYILDDIDDKSYEELIDNEFSDEESDEKKNSSTEPNNDAESDGRLGTNQGVTNNTKIQMGATRSGDNIIYKQRGLRN